MRLIHGLLLCGFLCGLLGIQEAHAAFSITRTSSSVFYLDTSASPQLRGMYVSYQITSTTAMTDVWAEINSFTGSVISRAPNEDGVVHLGAFSAGQTKT